MRSARRRSCARRCESSRAGEFDGRAVDHSGHRRPGASHPRRPGRGDVLRGRGHCAHRSRFGGRSRHAGAGVERLLHGIRRPHGRGRRAQSHHRPALRRGPSRGHRRELWPGPVDGVPPLGCWRSFARVSGDLAPLASSPTRGRVARGEVPARAEPGPAGRAHVPGHLLAQYRGVAAARRDGHAARGPRLEGAAELRADLRRARAAPAGRGRGRARLGHHLLGALPRGVDVHAARPLLPALRDPLGMAALAHPARAVPSRVSP